jgi:hypothetical protein
MAQRLHAALVVGSGEKLGHLKRPAAFGAPVCQVAANRSAACDSFAKLKEIAIKVAPAGTWYCVSGMGAAVHRAGFRLENVPRALSAQTPSP